MAALTAGTAAPEFSLSGMDGQKFSLREALKRGPVVVGFFKVSCPVCQLAFPYLERMHNAYRGKNVTFVGVSQNDQKETAQFARDYGISFPLLLDDTKKYPVSNAYGLTNVPTVFYIAPDGEIELAMVGWSRDDMTKINQELASAITITPPEVFHRSEDVPAFKPG
jgi:peroxiredoxin